MEASQVTEVVDKLAEKIGRAAESLALIAEEAVRQVSVRGLTYVGLGVLGLVAAAALAQLTVRTLPELDEADKPPVAVCGIGLAITALGFAVAGIITGISQWLAPIPYLLGK